MRNFSFAFLNKYDWLSSLLFGILGFFLILYITAPYGAGVSGDSVDYVSTADNLLKGNGFIDYAGEPYLFWPPLYPLLLAGLSWLTGQDPFVVARFLNAVCFGLIVFLSGLLFRRSLRQSPIWSLLGSLIVLTSLSLVSLATNITSDPLFIVLALGYALLGGSYLGKPSTLKMLMISLLVAIAAILRWHGAILVASTCILILITNRRDLKAALGSTFLVGLIGSLPFALWVIGRNYRLLGTFLGQRDTANIDFWLNLNDSSRKIAHWYLPDQILRHISPFVILALVFVILLIFNKRANWRNFVSRLISSSHLAWVVFALIYYLFVLSTSVSYDHSAYFDDRYYAPLFVFLSLLLILLVSDLLVKPLDAFLSSRSLDFDLVQILLVIFIFVWLIYPSYRLYKYTIVSRDQGEPTYNAYNKKRFHQSLLVRYVEHYPLEAELPVYSNNASAAYSLMRNTTLRSPNSARHRSDLDYFKSHFRDWPPSEQAYWIWFLPNYWGHYYPPEFIETIADLEPLFSSSDGSLYLVHRR
jgi:hypothetical protein